MLFYTRCYDVAKGKINVYETDTNSMKLEKWLQFEIGPKALIYHCNSKFVCHCIFFLRGGGVGGISYIHSREKHFVIAR